MMTRRVALSCLVLVVALSVQGGLSAQQPADRGTDSETVTAPVELDGDVLFTVRGVSSFPAAERARRVQEQIVAVAADLAIPVEAVRIVEVADTTRIQAGDRIILTIFDADASIEQVNRADLARAHGARVQQAIGVYRAARSPAALRRAAAQIALATLGFAVVAILFFWFWRRIDQSVLSRLRARIPTVGIQSFEVMRAEQIQEAVRGAFIALRTIFLLTFTLIYLGFVFSRLPLTRGLSRDMAGLALTPLTVIATGFFRNFPSLVFLAVLFVVIRLGLRLIRLFFAAVGQGTVQLASFDPEWAQPTYNIVRIAVVAFAMVVAYPYIPGSDSAAFRGVSLFFGIVFSLGSSSAVSNMIAGYMLIYRRAFKVGDRIKVGDSVGDVLATRLQVTHLRSVKNEELIIPNSQILGAEVVNYSSLARVHGLILHTEVGIGYETAWRQVEAMLIEAARRTPGLGTDPRPFVLERKLGSFDVTYELNVYCTNVQMMGFVYADLHRNILDLFNEHGVQIMTPAYEGDPEEAKVVPKKDWCLPPAKGPAPAESGKENER
jgi:small-conductance mechanosensitive channel